MGDDERPEQPSHADILALSFVFIDILALFPEICAVDVGAVREPPLPLIGGEVERWRLRFASPPQLLRLLDFLTLFFVFINILALFPRS
jgi:hypothetical protein